MVKRVRSEDDGYVNLVNDPISNGQGDVFELYAAIEGGKPPTDIKVQVSPDCGATDAELDFVGYGSIDLVAGPTVDRRVLSLLEANCYLINLRSNSKTYGAYLPRQFYDAIDLEYSIYERFDNERRSISRLRKIVLRESAIADADLFKVSGDRICRLPTFVSERFVEVYKDCGCTGLMFDDVELS